MIVGSENLRSIIERLVEEWAQEVDKAAGRKAQLERALADTEITLERLNGAIFGAKEALKQFDGEGKGE
jgi:hypothetical protein